jgi:hypothetical protein
MIILLEIIIILLGITTGEKMIEPAIIAIGQDILLETVLNHEGL